MSAHECEYSFTLILEGVSDLTEDVANRLFEAGCDDALLVRRDGVVSLGFDRTAPSLSEAIRSAIRDVKKANVTQAEIGLEIDSQYI